jgi:hypothetical protein
LGGIGFHRRDAENAEEARRKGKITAEAAGKKVLRGAEVR